jgi:carbohydrate-selective porin OprB
MFAAGEGAAFNDSFRAPFLIVQLEGGQRFFGSLGGNFRLYGWSNGQATQFNHGVTGEVHRGWGASVDQHIGDTITLFGRIGVSTHGSVKFDRAVTLGSEVGGSHWSRPADAIGLALGWLRPSEEYRAVNPAHEDTERLLELFYRWHLNSQLAMTPDLQLVRHAAGDSSADLLRFVGVRAAINF